MSNKKTCPVAPIINIRDHPLVPGLKVAEVAGNQVVTGDHYTEGQLGFFIPDGAYVPDNLAEEMWVKGRLSGNQRNRVKAKPFKGVQSDGLFYGEQGLHWNPDWQVGHDVSEEVGITFA